METNKHTPAEIQKIGRSHLHLYLGAEVEMYKFGYDSEEDVPTGEKFRQIEKLDNITLSILIDKQAADAYDPVLVLRPLSDMTEDEQLEVAEIIGVVNVGHFISAATKRTAYNLRWQTCSELFRYLLSHGFDLFGLIEMGAAFDKTKIQATT